MTELLPNIFAIQVPEGFNAVEDIVERYMDEVLPDGEFHILFTTKGVSEENAMLIATVREANGYPIGYKDYENDDESYREATDSLHSLLRSKGLTATNYLLIKKVG